jgi:YidC/Oxa1 family membrane protein insertase
MEKRAILAAVLMALLLMVYQAFFVPHELPPPAPKPPEHAQQPVSPAPAPAVTPSARPPGEMPRPQARPPQRLATVDAPLYRAVVSSEGGKLQEFVLKYRGEKPMIAVGDFGPVGLLVAPDARAAVEAVPMRLSAEAVSVRTGRGETLVLDGASEELRVVKTLRFEPDSYALSVTVRVENPTPSARRIAVELPWMSRIVWGDALEKFPGQRPIEVVWSVGGSVDRAPRSMYPSLDGLVGEPPRLNRGGEWVAIGSVWYVAALLPKQGGFQLGAVVEKPEEARDGRMATPGRVTVGVRATPEIAAGGAWEGSVAIYVGPKEYRLLRAVHLEETLNFGGFPIPWYWGGLPMRWVGVPILQLMNWVYGYVGNYGIAIILLTVISKVLFYPLTVKSVRSMKAMQALAPQINALRSKYKSDPQRLQKETMDLYRQHKVNPMGGCLPMLAQVPIFYALYLALSVSVELQNAPLLCFGRMFGVDVWVCDLASYDPTYVLPILMGVSMFVQQKMQPVVGDPRQAKMMLVMPFVFTFMFFNLPAGLVLYWTVSNILQILQQWYMDRPRTPTRADTKAPKAPREVKNAARA